MKIKNAEYYTTAVKLDQYPDTQMPEIALVGRSNVGKSSLINALVSQKGLARVSQHPGKTQTINFYKINDGIFYLVDLPGYGFAKVSKMAREQWSKMIGTYLGNRENLYAVMQLVDIRHAPSVEDKKVFTWLKQSQEQSIVICTKADKISRGNWKKHFNMIKKELGMNENDILINSSTTGRIGFEEIRNLMGEIII